MEKELKQEWNMVFGAQYQFNKRVQLRSEYRFLGDRTQFLASLNYRFLLQLFNKAGKLRDVPGIRREKNKIISFKSPHTVAKVYL